MKQMFSLLIAVVIATMMASVSFAQVGAETSRVNGVAVNGNTTTVFEAANESDLQMHLLTQWSGFAERHQKIAHQLGNRPRLIDDAGYLRKHPELAKLFDDNPDLLSAMKSNPDDFVANLPSSEE